MFPPRRVPLTLSIWLFGMAACFAQEAGGPDRSVWYTLVDGAPILWCGISIATIVAVALFFQLVFGLGTRRVNPPAFVEAFSHAIAAGNYQEAWETCNRWRQTSLARILQPALERIGQGREPVQTRLAEECRSERRHIHLLLWCMLGAAAGAAALCVAAISAELHAVALTAMSPHAPRALALAMGDIAMLAALAVAVLIPAGVSYFCLRARAERLLQAAGEEGVQLISSLPYEEIEGVRIGRDFNAGTMLGDVGGAPSKRLQVSRDLTSRCPSCNGPVNPTRDNCPHCGQLFSWS